MKVYVILVILAVFVMCNCTTKKEYMRKPSGVYLSWKTVTGFDDIDTLVFVRKVGGKEIERTNYTGPGVESYSEGKLKLILDENSIGDNEVTMNYEKDGELIEIEKKTFTVTENDIGKTMEDIRINKISIPASLDISPQVSPDEKYIVYMQYGKCTIGTKPFEIITKDSGKIQFKNGDGLLTVSGVNTFSLNKHDNLAYYISNAEDNNSVLTVTETVRKNKEVLNVSDLKMTRIEYMSSVQFHYAKAIIWDMYSEEDRYLMTMPGFDRVYGDIAGPLNVTLEQCREKCSGIDDCVGISYAPGSCYPKRENGLREYAVHPSHQFYERHKSTPAKMTMNKDNHPLKGLQIIMHQASPGNPVVYGDTSNNKLVAIGDSKNITKDMYWNFVPVPSKPNTYKLQAMNKGTYMTYVGDGQVWYSVKPDESYDILFEPVGNDNYIMSRGDSVLGKVYFGYNRDGKMQAKNARDHGNDAKKFSNDSIRVIVQRP